MSKSSIPILGNVHEGYSGPLYYGLDNDFRPGCANTRFRFREDKKKIHALMDTRNSTRHIFTAGIILDERGKLRDEWRTPLKGTYIGGGKPERAEWGPTLIAPRVRERVRDAIMALEPDRHVFIPIDVSSEAGEWREYLLFMADGQIWEPSILHPAKNKLERKFYHDGTPGWKRPWKLLDHPLDSDDTFVYLDGPVIEGRHLFCGGDVYGGWIISDELRRALSKFGRVFKTNITLCPMGVSYEDHSQYDPPPPPPELPRSAKRKTLWERVFG